MPTYEGRSVPAWAAEALYQRDEEITRLNQALAAAQGKRVSTNSRYYINDDVTDMRSAPRQIGTSYSHLIVRLGEGRSSDITLILASSSRGRALEVRGQSALLIRAEASNSIRIRTEAL